MIITKVIATELYTKIDSIKRISKLNFTEELFYSWIKTIQAMNALEEDTFVFEGVALEQWKVISELSDLILPAKVGVTVDRLSLDLRSSKYSAPHKDFDQYPLLTKDRFNDVSEAIAASVRATASLEAVSKLREVKQLTDVFERSIRDNKVVFSEASFYPICLSTNFIKDVVYTYEAKSMVIDWIRDRLVSINNK